MHLRADLTQTHAVSASIAPGTQKLTLRQADRVMHLWQYLGIHPANRLVRCSPHAQVFTLDTFYGKENIWLLRDIKPGLLLWELATTTTMLPINIVPQIWQFIEPYYDSPGLILDTFLFPVVVQDILLYPITPWDLAKSIQMIPTMGSSPSLFLCSI